MSGMKNRWLIFAIGFVMMLIAGLVFSWSIFVEPIENDLGFLRNETSLVFPISLSVSIIGQIIAGMFSKKKKITYNFVATIILCGVGFGLASTVNQIWMLYLSYGIFVGLAIGMIYNGVLSTVVLYFMDKKDLITGLLLMSFGLGSMALGTLSVALIENIGWRQTFIVLAFVFGILCFLGTILIRQPKVEIEEATYEEDNISVEPLEMVKKKSYLLTFVWITILVSSCLIILGHAALCVADIGASTYIAAFASGLVSITNVVSRFFISAIYKRLKTKKMQYLLTTIALISGIFCYFGYVNQQMVIILIGYGFIGVLNGGCTIVINSYVLNEFGYKNYGINMAITNIHMAIASLIGPALAGFFKDSFGSYTPAFTLMIILSIFAYGLVKLSNLKKKQQVIGV